MFWKKKNSWMILHCALEKDKLGTYLKAFFDANRSKQAHVTIEVDLESSRLLSFVTIQSDSPHASKEAWVLPLEGSNPRAQP